jgi:hypothetical protein
MECIVAGLVLQRPHLVILVLDLPRPQLQNLQGITRVQGTSQVLRLCTRFPYKVLSLSTRPEACTDDMLNMHT